MDDSEVVWSRLRNPLAQQQTITPDLRQAFCEER
jgi:hypothetical protein